MFIEAVLLGLMGSFHCMGMCGPIALALPIKENTLFSRISSTFLYNSGRTITYVVLGIILGFIGKNLAFWGFQRITSLVMGSVMILSVILPQIIKPGKFSGTDNPLNKLIQNTLGRMFANRNLYSIFIIGLLNGLLPCGLVYIALAGALITHSVFDGALYMFLFGAGTIPIMMAITIARSYISLSLRNTISKIIPYLIVLLGVLFILRGLNLGIPYISPKMEIHACIKCCH